MGKPVQTSSIELEELTTETAQAPEPVREVATTVAADAAVPKFEVRADGSLAYFGAAPEIAREVGTR